MCYYAIHSLLHVHWDVLFCYYCYYAILSWLHVHWDVLFCYYANLSWPRIHWDVLFCYYCYSLLTTCTLGCAISLLCYYAIPSLVCILMFIMYYCAMMLFSTCNIGSCNFAIGACKLFYPYCMYWRYLLFCCYAISIFWYRYLLLWYAIFTYSTCNLIMCNSYAVLSQDLYRWHGVAISVCGENGPVPIVILRT